METTRRGSSPLTDSPFNLPQDQHLSPVCVERPYLTVFAKSAYLRLSWMPVRDAVLGYCDPLFHTSFPADPCPSSRCTVCPGCEFQTSPDSVQVVPRVCDDLVFTASPPVVSSGSGQCKHLPTIRSTPERLEKRTQTLVRQAPGPHETRGGKGGERVQKSLRAHPTSFGVAIISET